MDDVVTLIFPQEGRVPYPVTSGRVSHALDTTFKQGPLTLGGCVTMEMQVLHVLFMQTMTKLYG